MYALSDTRRLNLSSHHSPQKVHYSFRHVYHKNKHFIVCSENKYILDYIKQNAHDAYHVVKVDDGTLKSYCNMYNYDLLYIKSIYCDIVDKKEKCEYEEGCLM